MARRKEWGMSRIEELESNISMHAGTIANSKRRIAELEKELAALKDAAAGPQQWTVYLSWNGLLYQTYGECPGGGTDKITVIEKKPIVITTELAQKMINAGRGFVVTPAWFVRALKAAGIEARCGDE